MYYHKPIYLKGSQAFYGRGILDGNNRTHKDSVKLNNFIRTELQLVLLFKKYLRN